MTKFKFALLAAVAGSVVASSAAAQDRLDLSGWYASLGAGVHNPDSSRVNAQIPAGTSYLRNKTTFGLGYGIHGAMGYEWPMGFRSELEIGYRSSALGRISIAGLSPTPFTLSGSQRVLGLMGNLLFDVGVGSNFKPYVGGGAGMGRNKWNGVAGIVTPTLSPTFNDSDTSFQWQAIVGVTIPINDRLGAYVDYRYIGSNKLRFDSTATNSVITNHDDSNHNLFVGFRYHFGKMAAPKAAMAAAAPPPPPPPAPPPPAPQAKAPPPAPAVPQKFLVFFDFDRSDLRPDAAKIVSEAADYAKKTGKAVIQATGHADTSGAPAYNLALSERRAQSVKASLLQMGFIDRDVGMSFKGESEPLVATGDGVREPQNRRVEIVMN